MKKMRGITSEKEKLSLIIQRLAKHSNSLTDLTDKLIKQRIKPYFRNDVLAGIILGKRKLRLSTLGIDNEKIKELKREEKRIAELNKIKYTKEIEIKK